MTHELDRSLDVREVTCALVRESFSVGLRSVILTGSLARGEGTWREQDGRIRLVGDVEHLLVFDDARALPTTKQVASLRDSIEARLAERGIALEVGLSPVTPDYFRSLRPHIFAYELLVHSKTLWGDDLRYLAPRFTVSDIPLEDGFRLLMNRVIELLEAIGSAAQLEPLPATVRHRAIKLCLDMATSFLLFSGSYEPSYRARETALLALMNHSPFVPLECARFAERTILATRWKLEGESREPIVSKADLAELIDDVHRLWRWELQRLGHPTDEAESDCKAIRAWCCSQAYYARLRGWAFVARACGWRQSIVALPRWVLRALRGSPRRLTYSAASALFFALSEILRRNTETPEQSSRRYLLRELPLPTSLAASTSWRAAAAAIASNYRRFLETTRA